jgi:hypothetical protein
MPLDHAIDPACCVSSIGDERASRHFVWWGCGLALGDPAAGRSAAATRRRPSRDSRLVGWRVVDSMIRGLVDWRFVDSMIRDSSNDQ